jgi:hypothetical protein
MFNRGVAVTAAAALLGVALVALPATADAVAPRGGHYAQSTNNIVVATFDVAGGTVRRFWHSDDCASYSVPVPPMRIGANGAFSFSGTGIKNGILHEYTVKVSGHALSRTVIAGTMTYQKTSGNGPACKTTTKFRAKRTGPART